MKEFLLRLVRYYKNRPPHILIVRTVLMSVCLIPFFMFFMPPKMDLHLYFHGQQQEGTINVYRSDDAVGYYFRSLFRVSPTTTSAYMKGVHENLNEFRVRFTNLDEIVLDSFTMEIYGLNVIQMSGAEMSDAMNVTKGVTINEDADLTEESVALNIAYDGAYFILQPKVYMHAGAWLYYIGLLFLMALPLSLVLQLFLFLLGVHNPVSEILFFATPAFVVSFGELACGSISAIPAKYFWLNYFVILGTSLFLRFLTRRSFSSCVTGVLFSCIYIANHFVYLFRGRPLLPWDLQAVGTAAEVAGAYDFKLDSRLIVLVLVAVLTLLSPRILKTRRFRMLDSFDRPSPLVSWIKIQPSRGKNILIRICGMLFGILVVVCALKSPVYAQLSAEAWDASIIIDYQKQGMPVTFLKFMDVYRVVEPEGYTQEALDEIKRTYAEEVSDDSLFFLPTGTKITEKPDRILMVMNESLSEISYANTDEAERVDTLPFMRSLKENTIRGSLYVSVRGGGTCNTEFETLTANAMGLLPPNTYPYQAYLKKQIPTLASYFDNEGYRVASLHLADRKNWKRSTVYPLLTLEPFYAYDNYSDVALLRGYATDASDYEKLIELDSKYNFIFNVTMQNHGGYSLTDDMQVTVDLSRFGEFSQAEVYYSLMKLSDEALQDLIGHYQNDETKTMLIVYGDHQPSLGTKTDDFLFDEDPMPLVKYETPFVIWANYDLPSLDGYRMSANYFSGLVLEAAGFPLTPYLRLAGDCYKEYPVITSYGVLDANGQYYDNADAVPDETGILNKYRIAQYNNLFDKDRMNELFENKSSQ